MPATVATTSSWCPWLANQRSKELWIMANRIWHRATAKHRSFLVPLGNLLQFAIEAAILKMMIFQFAKVSSRHLPKDWQDTARWPEDGDSM